MNITIWGHSKRKIIYQITTCQCQCSNQWLGLITPGQLQLVREEKKPNMIVILWNGPQISGSWVKDEDEQSIMRRLSSIYYLSVPFLHYLAHLVIVMYIQVDRQSHSQILTLIDGNLTYLTVTWLAQRLLTASSPLRRRKVFKQVSPYGDSKNRTS